MVNVVYLPTNSCCVIPCLQNEFMTSKQEEIYINVVLSVGLRQIFKSLTVAIS